MCTKSLLSAFVLFTVFELVFGATCMNSTTCVASTYTTGACDSTTKVCACLAGSAPIPTGCGSKLTKPTLAQPSGYSTVVLDGKSATLTCTSPDGATLFEWTLSGVVLTGATASTYTIAAASSSNVGTYTCKAKAVGYSSLDSDSSDGLVLEILLKTSQTLSNGPEISLPTTSVFTGKSVAVTCVNVPIGYDAAKVVITDATGATATSPVTITDTNKGTAVKCELTDTTSNTNKLTGATTNLPTIVTDISAVAISPMTVDNQVYTVDETITLKCVPTPDVPYIDTTKAITYVWMNNAQPLSGATSQTYDIPKAEGVYVIKCQATYTASFQSAVITITRSSTYLTKPVIQTDPATPVLGSRFTLACGSAVAGATYSWKKDGTEIARQLEQIIQLDNATTSDAGVYGCTAKRSNVIQTSDSYTVSFNSAPEVVKVSMFVLGLTLLMSKVFA